jgi:hypothetical protein
MFDFGTVDIASSAQAEVLKNSCGTFQKLYITAKFMNIKFIKEISQK